MPNLIGTALVLLAPRVSCSQGQQVLMYTSGSSFLVLLGHDQKGKVVRDANHLQIFCMPAALYWSAERASLLPSSAPVQAKLGGVSLIFDSSSRPAGIVVNQQEISPTCFVTLEGLIKQSSKQVIKILKRWKMTSRDDNLKGRRPQGKTNSIEDDF